MVVIGLDPLSSSVNGALHLFPETGSLSGCMIVNPCRVLGRRETRVDEGSI